MPDQAQQGKTQERIGTVFLVDDEPMVTASIQTMLSLETKHLIYAFNSPLDALEKLLEHRPDVIISDFSMPDMDGITFLKQIKQQLPQATLILLTGYADKESAIEAINTVGIYRYIEKPWDNEELKLNIKNGLERAHLVADLKDTIQQLTQAESQLRENNQQLEALVEARTQDLQVTYQKLQSIVQNSADGIITLNGNLELTSANPTAARWLDALHKSEQRDIQQSLADVLKIPGSRDINGLFSPEDRHKSRLIPEAHLGGTPLEISISPLTQPDPGYVLIMRDITQRKEIERLRDDFVSTLTHDLRTPLVAAIQTLTFFIDGTVAVDDHAKRQSLTEMLIQSLRDMLGMVNVLLEVYKYEAGQQRLVFDRLNLAELVQAVGDQLEALARSRDQALTLDLQSPDFFVTADKQEIKRVLINLIGNAIHHTPGGGQITVSITDEPATQTLLVCVADTGRGIPGQDIPHLFARFSQGTSAKRSSGSGLGLYLSRQIVQAHQGEIWVESQVGEGSRFYVRLPRADGQTAPV